MKIHALKHKGKTYFAVMICNDYDDWAFITVEGQFLTDEKSGSSLFQKKELLEWAAKKHQIVTFQNEKEFFIWALK
jgi:hypothetical protein